MIVLYQEVLSIVLASAIEFNRFCIVLGFDSIVVTYGMLPIAKFRRLSNNGGRLEFSFVIMLISPSSHANMAAVSLFGVTTWPS